MTHPNQPLACKECRWYKKKFNDIPRCTHTEASKYKTTTTNYVTGEVRKRDNDFCVSMRSPFPEGMCGEEGKWWEPKNEQKWIVWKLLKG